MRQGEHSILDSAIEATEDSTRASAINGQAETIKRVKTREETKNIPDIE